MIVIGKQFGKKYKAISDFLLSLNFNISSKGFVYWVYALENYRQNYYKYDNTIEKVYRDIAKYFNTTRNRVERDMRTASKEINLDKFNYTGKITNKNILSLITHYIIF